MRTYAALFILLAASFVSPACKKATPDTKNTKDAQIRDTVPAKVVVILAKDPDPTGKTISLQDYDRNGRMFIPIFRSKEAFQQSTKGGVKNPIYEIDRRLFVSMLKGSEMVIVDVALPSELVTNATDLKRIFPEPFNPPQPKGTP